MLRTPTEGQGMATKKAKKIEVVKMSEKFEQVLAVGIKTLGGTQTEQKALTLALRNELNALRDACEERGADRGANKVATAGIIAFDGWAAGLSDQLLGNLRDAVAGFVDDVECYASTDLETAMEDAGGDIDRDARRAAGDKRHKAAKSKKKS
jgi:hypothetical protein